MKFATSNALEQLELSTHFGDQMNRKDRIVCKELNESSAVRSACWQLYKNRKESKIVIRVNSRYTLTLYVASSCKDKHIRSLKHPYYIQLLNN